MSSRKIIALWWDHCIWLSPSSLQWHVTSLFLRFLGSTAQGALLSVEDKEHAIIAWQIYGVNWIVQWFLNVCTPVIQLLYNLYMYLWLCCQQPFLLISLQPDPLRVLSGNASCFKPFWIGGCNKTNPWFRVLKNSCSLFILKPVSSHVISSHGKDMKRHSKRARRRNEEVVQTLVQTQHMLRCLTTTTTTGIFSSNLTYTRTIDGHQFTWRLSRLWTVWVWRFLCFIHISGCVFVGHVGLGSSWHLQETYGNILLEIDPRVCPSFLGGHTLDLISLYLYDTFAPRGNK